MDTSKLKRFATEARNILIQGVKQRLSALGFTDKGTATEEPQLFEGGATFMGEVVSTDFYHKWMSLQQAVSQKGIKVVEEEAAYTWFNRLVAIRIMVKNGIIAPVLEYESEDSRIPVLVSEARQGRIPSMDERTRELWNGLVNDDSKTNEQFALLIVAFCHATPIINKCFGHIADYTELLLPTNILAEGGFVDMMNHTDYISETDYKSPELIGWLYQFYISQRKDEVMAKKGKYTADEIPAATQIFTPNWIVKYMVQNTVGRIYLDNNEYADELKESWKYLVESEPTPEVDKYHFDDLADLKVADLACGSGHILNEAFDLLFQLYTYEGYSRTNAIEQIFHRNLTGIDLDTRAKQLATFALLLKACQKDNSFADAHCLPRIYDMPVPFCQSIGKTYNDSKEEAEIIRPYVRELIMADNKDVENEIIDAIVLMDNAQTLGSIMKFNLSERTRNILSMRAEEAKDSPLQPYITIILELTEKYAALVMNPPYMGSGNMNAVLSKYVKDNYPEGKADMMTVFMIKAMDAILPYGYWSMINLPSWMFLSSFEMLRKRLLESQHIHSLLHLGRGVFGSDFGSVAFTIQKAVFVNKGYYRRLFKEHVQVRTVEKIHQLFLDKSYGEYWADQQNFNKIQGVPLAYWINCDLFNSFAEVPLHNYVKAVKGLDTCDNNRFTRIWSEISFKSFATDISDNSETFSHKWFPYCKGGGFRKWYGLKSVVVNWENDGLMLRNLRDEKGKIKSRPQNTKYYFKEGITWCSLTASKPSMRYMKNCIFGGGGSGMFTTEIFSILAFLNSIVARYLLNVINPTINYLVGDFIRLPKLFNSDNYIEESVKENIYLSKQDWDSHETSWDFEENPLVALAKEASKKETARLAGENGTVTDAKDATSDAETASLQKPHVRLADVEAQYEAIWTKKFLQLHANEEELNRRFIDIYGLQDELTPDVPLSEVTILQQGEISVEREQNHTNIEKEDAL